MSNDRLEDAVRLLRELAVSKVTGIMRIDLNEGGIRRVNLDRVLL